MFTSPVPRRHKGRIAIVTDVVRNAVDGSVPLDERHGCGRRRRVVLAPQRLALKLAMMRKRITRVTVAIGKVHRGERAISRKPSRREGRLTPPVPVVDARFAQIFLRGGTGCMRPPGLPCALVVDRGRIDKAKLGRNAPRECTGVSRSLLRIMDLSAMLIVVPSPTRGEGTSMRSSVLLAAQLAASSRTSVSSRIAASASIGSPKAKPWANSQPN